MPQKDRYQIRQRNAAIRETFFHYIQTGMPRMEAYAKTGEEYFLGEERIRQIVAKRLV